MPRRCCCNCKSETLIFPGFTCSGTGTLCNAVFTPDSSPGWCPSGLSYITLDATSYEVSGNTADAATLAAPPTKTYTLNVTKTGTGTLAGNVLTPDPAPTGWSTNRFAGLSVTVGGSPYTVSSNTTTTLTLNTSPPTGFVIDFTASGDNGTLDGSGWFTPTIAPTGWTAGALIGLYWSWPGMNIWFPIIDNTTTAVKLDSPTLDPGDYGWDLGLWYESLTLFKLCVLSGPCTNAGRVVTPTGYDASNPTGWIAGMFNGCNATVNGVAHTIDSNAELNFTTGEDITSSVSFTLPITVTGECRICDDTITAVPEPGDSHTWNHVGIDVTIGAETNTVTSEAAPHGFPLVCDGSFTNDYSWEVDCPWTVDSGTWTVDGSCGATITGGGKITWGTALTYYQYSVTVTNDTTDGTKYRLYFGPDGDYYFEWLWKTEVSDRTLTLYGPLGEIHSEACTGLALGCFNGPSVCVFYEDGNYQINAISASDIYPQAHFATIDATTWEASPHKIGIGSDGTATFDSFVVQETKGAADNVCQTCEKHCGGCLRDDWPDAWKVVAADIAESDDTDLQRGRHCDCINTTYYVRGSCGGTLTLIPTCPPPTCSGTGTVSGDILTPSPSPANWHAGEWAGKTVHLGGYDPVVEDNTATSLTLPAGLIADGTYSWSLDCGDFTNSDAWYGDAIGITIDIDWQEETKYWELTISVGGGSEAGKLEGDVFTPNTAPTDWFADKLIGHHIWLDGAEYHILDNDTESVTIEDPPVHAWSIAFTVGSPATGGDVLDGVLTPLTPPTGWVADRLTGLYCTISGTDYLITDNDTTTLTLDSPPANGSYFWTLKGIVVSGTHGLLGNTNVTPQVADGTLNWTAGLFDGCSATVNGSSFTIDNNTTLRFTVTAGPLHADYLWDMSRSWNNNYGGIETKGQAHVAGTLLTPTNGYPLNWMTNDLAGVHIRVHDTHDNSSSYTTYAIDSNTTTTATLDSGPGNTANGWVIKETIWRQGEEAAIFVAQMGPDRFDCMTITDLPLKPIYVADDPPGEPYEGSCSYRNATMYLSADDGHAATVPDVDKCAYCPECTESPQSFTITPYGFSGTNCPSSTTVQRRDWYAYCGHRGCNYDASGGTVLLEIIEDQYRLTVDGIGSGTVARSDCTSAVQINCSDMTLTPNEDCDASEAYFIITPDL